MKRLAEDSQRFRVEDVPPRLHEKERVAHSFREIEKQLRESGEQLDRDLHGRGLRPMSDNQLHPVMVDSRATLLLLFPQRHQKC